MTAIDDAYRNKPDDCARTSAALAKAIDTTATIEPADELPDVTHLNTAVQGLGRAFDAEWGGFGQAPKFPSTFHLELMLRAYMTTAADAPQDIVATTLDAMASGGMYDHIGGGFARYSVDREWLVPHFEKMLYDQALLVRTYLHGLVVIGGRRMAPGARRDDHLRPPAAAPPRRRLLLGRGRRLARCRRARRGGAVPHVDARRGPCGDGAISPTTSRRRRSTGSASPTDGNFRGPRRSRTGSTPAASSSGHRTSKPHDGRCSPPANVAGVPGSTTRCSPSGTRCSCRPWPKPAPRSVSRSGSTRRSPTASSCSRELRRPNGRWWRSWQADGEPQARHDALAADHAALVDAFTRLAEATGQARWIDEAVAVGRHDARVVLGSGERWPLHDRRGRRSAHRPAEGPGRQRDTVGELDGGDRAVPPRGAHR